MNKIYKKLLILFLVLLVLKVVIGLFMTGPFIFPDETCVVQKAIYFSKYFILKSCSEITSLPAEGIFPLYPVLISPIYIFFHGFDAYYGVLILNSVLFSTLVFPLYFIYRKFLKENWRLYATIFVTLFLAQIVLFEKMLMTEGLFIVLNIWFLHFYLESFNKNFIRNKVLAVIFGILAALTRPFGFIVLLAMAVNEIIVSKKRKRILFIFVPLAVLAIVLPFTIFLPDLATDIYNKIFSLFNFENWVYIYKSLKNQLNSFTIATFLVPIVVFVTYIKRKDSRYLKKIKFYLITFIILNFIISAQHIYGYYLGGVPLNLLTRYVNMSIIYLFIFAFIFLQRYKKFKFTKTNLIVIVAVILSLLSLEDGGKHAQNVDLSIFFEVLEKGSWENEFIYSADTNLIIWGMCLVPLFLLILNRRRMLIGFLVFQILVYSTFSLVWIAIYPHDSVLADYFSNVQGKKITYLVGRGKSDLIHVWKILALSDNKVDYVIRTDEDSEWKQSLETDYIISEYDLNLPVIFKKEEANLYKFY